MRDGLVLIDDKFLEKEEIENLHKKIMSQGRRVWAITQSTNVYDPEGVSTLAVGEIKETFHAVCPIFPAEDRDTNELSSEIYKIFNKFLAKNSIFCKNIIRIKINLLSRDSSDSSGKHHIPHIDNNDKHLVFLYYVNDSDGDTFFFNEMYDGNKVENLTIMDRISPSAGKAVLFDGYRYHASSSPVENNYRVIINIDFYGGEM